MSTTLILLPPPSLQTFLRPCLCISIILGSFCITTHIFLLRFRHVIKLKFIYSEKATHFCQVSTVDLSYVVTAKSTVEISQNFVDFSEYMNFTSQK